MNWEGMTWKEGIDKRTSIVKRMDLAQFLVAAVALVMWLLNVSQIYTTSYNVQITTFSIVLISIAVLSVIKNGHQSDIDFSRKTKVSELLRSFFAISIDSKISLPELDKKTERVFFDRLWETADLAGVKFSVKWLPGDNVDIVELTRLPDDAIQKKQFYHE